MKRAVFLFLVVMFAAGNSFGKIHSWRGGVHLAAVPLIAGTGIYSSIRTLQDTDKASTRAAAFANLGLLGAQTCGGATLLFTSDDLPPVVRTIHRIVGAGVIASGLWLSIAGTLDDQVSPAARYTAYGHTVLAAAPILVFAF